MRAGLLTLRPLRALLSAEGLLASVQINATQIWRKEVSGPLNPLQKDDTEGTSSDEVLRRGRLVQIRAVTGSSWICRQEPESVLGWGGGWGAAWLAAEGGSHHSLLEGLTTHPFSNY